MIPMKEEVVQGCQCQWDYYFFENGRKWRPFPCYKLWIWKRQQWSRHCAILCHFKGTHGSLVAVKFLMKQFGMLGYLLRIVFFSEFYKLSSYSKWWVNFPGFLSLSLIIKATTFIHRSNHTFFTFITWLKSQMEISIL